MNYFENIDIFESLGESDQIHLSGFCQKQNFSQGEYLFHEGDESQAMYMIFSGSFGVLKNSEELVILGKGDVVGEMAFLDPTRTRNASVVAKEPSQVVTIIRFAFDSIAEKNPDLYEKFAKIIEKRK